MVNAEKFESRIETALQDKLDIDSPYFKETIGRNLNGLLRGARNGTDAVLLELLNCTVGGAGNQPLEGELVAAATANEKRNALRKLANSLSELQKAGVEQKLVGDLADRLKPLFQ